MERLSCFDNAFCIDERYLRRRRVRYRQGTGIRIHADDVIRIIQSPHTSAPLTLILLCDRRHWRRLLFWSCSAALLVLVPQADIRVVEHANNWQTPRSQGQHLQCVRTGVPTGFLKIDTGAAGHGENAYNVLSTCARGPHTAGPLLLFNTCARYGARHPAKSSVETL